MEWQPAEEIKKDIEHIVKVLDMPHINSSRIFCYRTHGSKSRSYARIWSFPKIFQTALNVEAAYVIEVLSKYFDKLDHDNQKKVLIHELLHIPKNFSGALLSHNINGRRISILTNQLFKEYKKLSK
ncbi:MAG: putative metallopeptidase [Candidatus Levybacteria bacterium]|nr:putative metallopeptidase [Candidatus Levybacteria bacterium]